MPEKLDPVSIGKISQFAAEVVTMCEENPEQVIQRIDQQRAVLDAVYDRAVRELALTKRSPYPTPQQEPPQCPHQPKPPNP